VPIYLRTLDLKKGRKDQEKGVVQSSFPILELRRSWESGKQVALTGGMKFGKGGKEKGDRGKGFRKKITHVTGGA